MKFLADAHLPPSLWALLRAAGHEAVHTSRLPARNRASDRSSNDISVRDQRVVVTKDAEFYHSHVLQRKPRKLLWVRTGNIRTRDPNRLFEQHLPAITAALEKNSLVELHRCPFGSSCDAAPSAPARNELFMAKAIELALKPGDKAPEFTALTQHGTKVSLSDFKGKHVVLYFYPRDDTPGCTKEACGFRDAFRAFKQKGVTVLGVSTDTPKSHAKFARKYQLPFELLVDEDKSIVQAYGVWGEKRFMGRKYQGTHRVTFLIGPDGKIKQTWPAVKPEEHAAEVLSAI